MAEPDDRADLVACWNNGRDTERIMHHIRKYRGVEYALGEAQRFAGEAKGHLAMVPPSDARDLLVEMSDYVVSRRS